LRSWRGDYNIHFDTITMRLLIQRIQKAEITINSSIKKSINQWIIVYLWVHKEDTIEKVNKAIERTLHINIFENETGKLKISSIVDWPVNIHLEL